MRLYIGNLPYSCSENDLKELFAEFNTSSIKLIIDHSTGRSKGFGFVDIESDEEGQRAIQTLDKHVIEGKTLVVNEARPQQPREKRDNNNNSSFRRQTRSFRQ